MDTDEAKPQKERLGESLKGWLSLEKPECACEKFGGSVRGLLSL